METLCLLWICILIPTYIRITMYMYIYIFIFAQYIIYMYVFICSLVVHTLVAWSSYTSMTRNTSSRHSTHNIYLPIFGYSLGGKCRWIQHITTRLFRVFSTSDKNVTPWNSLKLNSQSLWKPFVFMCLSLAIISFRDGKVRWFYPITLASKGWKKSLEYHTTSWSLRTWRCFSFQMCRILELGVGWKLLLEWLVLCIGCLDCLDFKMFKPVPLQKKMGPSTFLLCCFPSISTCFQSPNNPARF